MKFNSRNSLVDNYKAENTYITNLNMKDKLITLFLCLKSLTGKSTKKNKGGDPLFTDMDLNDIAQFSGCIVLHTRAKIDSVERRIYDVNTSLKSDDPTFMELSKALQKFFFHYGRLIQRIANLDNLKAIFFLS